MFHVAFTPNTTPANAIHVQAPTLLCAMAELLQRFDADFECGDWLAPRVLEAMQEATANLEDDEPAKGTWSDMGCEDDAFSIDIFCADDAKYVKFGDDLLLVPHGAVGLAIGKHNHQEWLYEDPAEDDGWEDVLLPHVAYQGLDGLDTVRSASPSEAIENHNAPLRAAMFTNGCEWKSGSSFECFTKDGKDVPYPVGYIRGPHYHAGTQRPYAYSVQAINGWLQLSFPSNEEGSRWALKTATVLTKPRITNVSRDELHGYCTLIGHFDNGSERTLFSFFVDELVFNDSDLLGLTEDEAHRLHQQRDTAYLRS